MSVQALGWVFDHSPTSGSDRLILLAIANHAGQDPTSGAWESWPGVELLQREAGLARVRTVREVLTRLTGAGHIERVVNGAPDERIRPDRRPNLYRIMLVNGVSCNGPPCRWCGGPDGAQRGAASQPNGGPFDSRTGGRETAPEPLVNQTNEPPTQPRLLPRQSNTALFDTFWQTYPKRVDKGTARQAWKRAVAKVGPDVITAGAAAYRDDPNRVDEYTKNPATWLNAEAWSNPPLPSRERANRTDDGIDTDRDQPSGRIDL